MTSVGPDQQEFGPLASNVTMDSEATYSVGVTLADTYSLYASPLSAIPLLSLTALNTDNFRSFPPLTTPTKLSEALSDQSYSKTPSMVHILSMPCEAMNHSKSTQTVSPVQHFAPVHPFPGPSPTASQLALAYHKIMSITSQAYEFLLSSLIYSHRFVPASPLYLRGLMVCLTILAVSFCLKFFMHQNMKYFMNYSIKRITIPNNSDDCKFYSRLPLAGFEEPSAADLELQTNSRLVYDIGVLTGDAGESVLCVLHVGEIYVFSQKETGEVWTPGSQDKVDKSFDENSESQTMTRRSSGTYPWLCDTSLCCQREQSEAPDTAHTSKESAFELSNLVHSSQETTFNSQISRDRKLISPVKGHAALNLPSPLVNHTNVSQFTSTPSSMINISTPATSPDSAKSLSDECHIYKTPSDGNIVHKERKKPTCNSSGREQGVEDLQPNSNVDRSPSDILFFLGFQGWMKGKAKSLINELLPSNVSLCWSYLRGKKLGQGAFSKVRLCQLGEQQMVIKRTLRGSLDSFFVACEVAVMRALDHPNIVRSFTASRCLTHFFLAIEYMDGGDLNQYKFRRESSNVPEDLVGIVMREVLKGLAYMHERNYAHCDIKPENIFLSKNGNVKIGDFGLARDIRVRDNFKRGSMAFMPPESMQMIHSTAGDIWALAITAIDLFTGEWLYGTYPPDSFLQRYIAEGIGLKRASGEFKEFLTLALQHDRTKRATAKDLLELPFIKNAPPTSALIA